MVFNDMSPDEIQAYSAIVQTIIAFLTLIVTGALTYLVYRGTKAIAAIEYSRSIRDAWLTIDSVALSNDEILKTADKLMDASTVNDPIELRPKRWLAFMVFNILISIFEGQEQAFLKDEDVKTAFDQILMPLIIDNDSFILTQSKGHPPRFSAYCKKLREEYKNRESLAEAQANKSFEPTAK
jgi:hypothetical protein